MAVIKTCPSRIEEWLCLLGMASQVDIRFPIQAFISSVPSELSPYLRLKIGEDALQDTVHGGQVIVGDVAQGDLLEIH